MFQSEEIIQKHIVTPDGEDEFQIRFIRSEQVGVVSTRSDKSWFLLDSQDFWYDLIQEEYPAKKRCRCKNDYFRLYFDFVPRIHTEDYRAVELSACCTQCGKPKNLGTVEIDYSPSAQLFSHPLTFCPHPKLKYKTYAVQGCWTEEYLHALTAFLAGKMPFMYGWYFDRADHKRYIRSITAEELNHFLCGGNFIRIFFSRKPLDIVPAPEADDGRGAYVDDTIWRKQEVFMLKGPFLVAGRGYFYSMVFCSEYIDRDGQVQAKSEAFSKLVQDFRAYSKKALRNA